MDNLKVSELREELRRRGLNYKGTKKTLIRRLRAAVSDENAGNDSTAPGSTRSLRADDSSNSIADDEADPIVQPRDSVSYASSSVHSAKTGSSISESLFVRQADAAANRAGLEAKVMLLAEKQRLTEETRAARQRELDLDLQRERLELEMAIVESKAREREFGKFKANFDRQIGINNSANIKSDAGHQTVVKSESPEHHQAEECGVTAAPKQEVPIVNLNTSSNDTFTQMLRLTERNSIPRVEIEKFGGDVWSYRSFIRAFDHLICDKVQNEDEKLYYLEQYTTGQPRDIVRGCLHMPTGKGYKEARRLFEARYGNQHKIAACSVDRILNWPTIRVDDINAMDDFSIALRTCYNSMADKVAGVSELDHPKTIRRILEKLPVYIQHGWRRLADDVSEQRNRMVVFKDLVDFVEKETRILTNPLFGRHLFMAGEQSERRQRSGPSKQYTLAAKVGQSEAASQPMSCMWCEAMHPLNECSKFVRNPMEVKKEFIRNKSLCYGCLSPGHMAKDCTSRSICRVCNRRHATALHVSPDTGADTRPRTDQVIEMIKNGRVNISTGKSLAHCGMAIVPVKIKASTGRCVETYAFLDNGSSASFCTESLCKKLHMYDLQPIELKLTTVQSRGEALLSKKVDGLMLSDLDENEYIPLPPVYTIEYIPVSQDDMLNVQDVSKFPYLSDIYLPQIDAGIELMIGNNVPQAMEPWEVRHSEENGPFAIRTKLGWVVTGPVRDACADRAQVNRTCISVSDHQLCDTFQNMYEQEFPEKNHSVERGLSNQDRKWMKLVQSSCTMSSDGHYEIGLPLRQADRNLPNNLELAKRRLEGLKRKLLRDSLLQEHYVATMTDMISKGYVERAPEQDPVQKYGKTWYLPHHGVYHPQKPHKVRVVFDGAASFKGTSLNESLLQGPDLTNPLIDVLLQFRWAPVCFTADIEAMFHQVRVPERDRDFLRFLWWEGGDMTKQPAEYRFRVHPFGATSSPASANYALRKTASDYGSHFLADTAETILCNFYVDDCLKSVETDSEGITIAKELIELCSLGGFRLTKFLSASSALHASVAEENRKTANLSIELGQDKMNLEKALGVTWSLATDSFGFSVTVKDKPMSKRGVLAIVGSVYDPFGLASPCVLVARQLLRDLCKLKISWDEEIPRVYQKTWQLWLNDLRHLSDISIPRCLRPRDFGDVAMYQLHHFSDGSESGYGTVSYLRVVNNKGEIYCCFVFGRSRLAPMKGTTIPRLELAAATLAVKMDRMIQRALRTKIESWFWTDSTAVLRYIRNERTRFHTFVANRLAVIREGTSPQQWRYVQSHSNPADIASRGARVDDIMKSTWFTGPDFLWKQSCEWPAIPENLGDISQDMEVRRDRHSHREEQPVTASLLIGPADLKASCVNIDGFTSRRTTHEPL